MADYQYVHTTRRDAKGRYRPSAWHIVLTPTRMFNTYRTYCGRTLGNADVMSDTPNAATCESCYRNAAKAEERAARTVP